MTVSSVDDADFLYVDPGEIWILINVFSMTLLYAPRLSRLIERSGVNLVHPWQVVAQAGAGSS